MQLKLIFTVPYGCEQPATYDTAVLPIPRVGELVLVQANLEERFYANFPKMPRQVRCVVTSVEYNLAEMTVTVGLDDVWYDCS